MTKEQQYATLTAQIALLEAQKNALKLEIISAMNEAGESSKDTVWGKFTAYYTSSWTYTDAVKKLEEKVKIAKIKEEQKGIAKRKVSQALRYTARKED